MELKPKQIVVPLQDCDMQGVYFRKSWSVSQATRIHRLCMTQPKPHHKIHMGLDSAWSRITIGDQSIKSLKPIPKRFQY